MTGVTCAGCDGIISSTRRFTLETAITNHIASCPSRRGSVNRKDQPMPVCTICQGDGVANVLNQWYCVDHLEASVTDLIRFVATTRGWDPDEAEQAVMDWMMS